jgi:hypothetical protein
MALTLIEAAKLHTGDVLRSAIIEIYAQNSDILRVLPFENIAGNALRYNREETLPGVGFRGVNEGYTESMGVLNPQTEPLVIAGGDLDVDKFILDTMGADQRAVHEAMKVKALSLRWTKEFIKGDSQADPKVFDGLQVRLTGTQLIENGSTSGGDALSLAKLDELIDAVDQPTHLLMNKTHVRLLSQAARTYTVGGFITYTLDEFGRRVTQYNGLPILVFDFDNNYNQILAFDEAGGGGGTTSSSIYCVSLGDGAVMGLQNQTVDVRDLGELESKPVFRTRVEWYNGIAVFKARAAARLRGIKNIAVVA